MKLRYKTLILTAILWSVTLILVNWISWSKFKHSLASLEEADCRAQLSRVLNMLKMEQQHLDTFTHDWAAWDDTYAYMQSRDPAYEKSNFLPSTFKDSKINLILLIGESGEVVYRQCRDYPGNEEIQLDGFMDPRYSPDHPFFKYATIHAPQPQLCWTNGGLILLSIQPVTHSDNSGPRRGLLVMGRFLKNEKISAMRETVQIPFRIARAPKGAAGLAVNRTDLFSESPLVIAARTVLPDFSGTPNIQLTAPLQRNLYYQVRQSWKLFFTGILFFSFLAAVAVALLLERTLLRRLGILTGTVSAISTSGRFTQQIPDLGNDELGVFGREINRLLQLIEAQNRDLKVSEARYRSFLEHFPGIVYQKSDSPTRFAFYYGAVENVTGQSASALASGAVDWEQLVEPDDLPRYRAVDAEVRKHPQQICEREYRIRHPDGQTVYLREFVQRLPLPGQAGDFWEGTIYDVTSQQLREMAQKRIETQLQRTQHLESIGLLASGVAHDFNNILQGILGHTSLALKACDALPAAAAAAMKPRLDIIERASQRGATLIRDLLTFSRQSKEELQSIAVNGVVREVHQFLERTFPRDIRFELRLHDVLPPVLTNRSQLVQVLLNLCLNARDAMPKGGELTVTTGMETWKGIPAVTVAVADTGIGVPEEIRDRVFDPFFTTKPPGQGTGLGLSMAYGAMQANGGGIAIHSSPGKGSVFVLYFPVAEMAPDRAAAVRTEAAVPPSGGPGPEAAGAT